MRYIEIIILINLVIHISFIGIANYVFKQKKNRIMIFLSCVLDIIYTLMYIYFPYELEAYKYIFIYVISIVPFLMKGIYKSILSSFIYLLLNFTLGGSAEILYLTLNNYWAVIISLIIMLLVVSIVCIYKRIHFNLSKLNYSIYIEDGNNSYYLDGYCDTGNFLVTDDNIPIVFLNNKIQIGRYKKSIVIKTVSIEKQISLYEVKEFKIKIKNKYVKKEVYLAYADISCMVMFGLNILGG